MKLEKKIVIVCILFIIMILINTKVNAAYANIKANKTKVMVGDTVTISVSVEAAAWNIKTSGAAVLNEADSSSDGENVKKTFTTSFKASKAGTYQVDLSGDVSDGETMATKNVSGSVKIEAEEPAPTKEPEPTKAPTPTKAPATNNDNTQSQASSDATLKNLGIKPNDFSGFKKAITTYNVQVPYSTEKINIYAKASDSKATVTGTGDKTLNVGSNSFSVDVLAEDKKTTKTYTINITRKEEQADEKDKENKKALGIYKLSLTGIQEDGSKKEIELNKEFERERLEYICDAYEDTKKIEVNAEAYEYNDSIKITGNESELKDGENIITISVGDGKDTVQYIIKVNKGTTEVIPTQTPPIQQANPQVEQKQNSLINKIVGAKNVIMKGFICLIVIELLIVFYLVLTKKKTEKEENK